MGSPVLDEKLQSAKTLTTVIYGLYFASLFVGLTCIIAIIINYVKQGDVQGSFMQSHFRWQIRTFWFALLWVIIGGVTTFIGVGFVILFINAVWFIYRIVKGFLYLNDNKPMYAAG